MPKAEFKKLSTNDPMKPSARVITTSHQGRFNGGELLINTCQHCESIINFLPDPTFAVNLEGEVIAWNHAIETLSGIAAEDILGQGDYVYAIPYPRGGFFYLFFSFSSK